MNILQHVLTLEIRLKKQYFVQFSESTGISSLVMIHEDSFLWPMMVKRLGKTQENLLETMSLNHGCRLHLKMCEICDWFGINPSLGWSWNNHFILVCLIAIIALFLVEAWIKSKVHESLWLVIKFELLLWAPVNSWTSRHPVGSPGNRGVFLSNVISLCLCQGRG